MSKIITPKSLRNQKAREQRPATVEEVKTWIQAGALAAGQKVYTELSQQHRNVFEMQEAAFMAVIETLHKRLSVLEGQAGIASPDAASIREELERAFVAKQNEGEENNSENNPSTKSESEPTTPTLVPDV